MNDGLNSFSFSRKGWEITVKRKIKLTVSINTWCNSVAYCLVEYPAHYVQASALKKAKMCLFSQLLHQVMRQKPVTLSFKYETKFCSSLLVFSMLLWGDTWSWWSVERERERERAVGHLMQQLFSTMTVALLTEKQNVRRTCTNTASCSVSKPQCTNLGLGFAFWDQFQELVISVVVVKKSAFLVGL